MQLVPCTAERRLAAYAALFTSFAFALSSYVSRETESARFIEARCFGTGSEMTDGEEIVPRTGLSAQVLHRVDRLIDC